MSDQKGHHDALRLEPSNNFCLASMVMSACLLALPFCDSACICARLVSMMLVDRAPGQNTTSKPAPDGMMKVDVWSSKAIRTQLVRDGVTAKGTTYHSCKRQGRLL